MSGTTWDIPGFLGNLALGILGTSRDSWGIMGSLALGILGTSRDSWRTMGSLALGILGTSRDSWRTMGSLALGHPGILGESCPGNTWDIPGFLGNLALGILGTSRDSWGTLPWEYLGHPAISQTWALAIGYPRTTWEKLWQYWTCVQNREAFWRMYHTASATQGCNRLRNLKVSRLHSML